MDILSPDDLKVGNEYIFETQPPSFIAEEPDDIMELITQYNGTYTYTNFNSKNGMIIYEFINTKYRLQLLYNLTNTKFYGYFTEKKSYYCFDISELSPEYFTEIDGFMYCCSISEQTNEYVLK